MPSAFNLPLQFLNLWLTLLLIWVIANNTLASETLITGAVVTAIIALAFSAFSRVYSVVRWSPRILYTYVCYFSVFIYELIRANIYVMRLVFSPRLNIKPGIVKVRTELTSPMGRLALANSITLTPGTLVVDIKDDTLYVHWIMIGSADPVEATREISGRFEKYLKVIYG